MNRELPYERSQGNGSSAGYTVEARLNNEGRAKVVCGLELGPKWVQVPTEKSPIGVPSRILGAPSYSDLLTYPAAQALRWWFHAAAPYVTGLETRLVEHRLEYTYKVTALAAIAEIALDPGANQKPDAP